MLFVAFAWSVSSGCIEHHSVIVRRVPFFLFGAFILFTFAFRLSVCPRCRRLFFVKGMKGYTGAKNCVNCGLSLYADRITSKVDVECSESTH